MRKKPCTWNGIEYSSITDAARAIGLSEPAMKYRIDNGWVCDADMLSSNHRRGVVCEWNGKTYKSIQLAAESIGVSQAAMSRRVSLGYTCDDDLKWRRD